MSARGPQPTPDVHSGLETSCAPTERAAWDTAADRCAAYEQYLLGRPSPATANETKLLARYRQAEQAAWDAYKAACRRAQGVAA